jgi:hypothetical protein
MYYNINQLEHVKEFNSLPKPYSLEMAIKNNEIPDKVRIIRYGADNPCNFNLMLVPSVIFFHIN